MPAALAAHAAPAQVGHVHARGAPDGGVTAASDLGFIGHWLALLQLWKRWRWWWRGINHNELTMRRIGRWCGRALFCDRATTQCVAAWYVGAYLVADRPRHTTRHAWDTALVRTHPRDRQPVQCRAPATLCVYPRSLPSELYRSRPCRSHTVLSRKLLRSSSDRPYLPAHCSLLPVPAYLCLDFVRADPAVWNLVQILHFLHALLIPTFFFITEVTMTFSESFYKYLKDNNAPQEILDRYEEYHPRPKTPTTLPEALADVKEQSTSTNSQPVGPWYGLRHRLPLTCAQEYRMEHVLKYYL